ncbi:MAG: uroporphyrinogen-III C-methyltransferase, partial [Candidatus Omnitrophota bacterium]
MKKGKVYLVGAGPGDPNLLTLKGLECLRGAGVIIYDRLVNPRLLKFASPTAEFIYAGKSPEGSALSQAKINLLLVKKARQGKVVLRLKGGDAFLFARGAEEALFLAKQNIPFEVVPGVSSAIAVPAYAGIPLTHRDYTSSVGIFTGHEDPNKKDSSIDWQRISAGLGTQVFLMGVGNLPAIVNKLIKFGRAKTTPCSLIQWGTLPKQRTVVATLQTIVGKAKKAGISHPAIFIVGEVVKLKRDLNWFEDRPLFGKRVLVVCHQQEQDELSLILENYGASVVELPIVQISPLKNYKQLDSAIKQMANSQKGCSSFPIFDWVIFSSQNGVRHFIERLGLLKNDLRILGGAKLAAIGPKTKMALGKSGVKADMHPRRYCQEGLLDLFRKRRIKGKSFLIVCSTQARDTLAKGLEAMGAKVIVAHAYDAVPSRHKGKTFDKILKDISHRDSIRILNRKAAPAIDLITFTSAFSVRTFLKNIPAKFFNQNLSKSLIATIGPVTSREIRCAGLKVDIQAKEYTKQALAEAIIKRLNKRAP